MTARELLADRRWRWTGIAAVVVLVLLLILATFPFGWLKPSIEHKLSARIDRQVTIVALIQSLGGGWTGLDLAEAGR